MERGMTDGARVAALYRYPLKGFSSEPLDAVDLAAGETVPFDRAFAIENGPSGFDPAAPRHLPKSRFLMLMRNERCAAFASRFSPETGVLEIVAKDGSAGIHASTRTESGRAMLEAWFAETFADELRGPPRLLEAPDFSFSDVAEKVVHLVNLESLRDLERRAGRPLDVLRFRPNIVVDGSPAFAELDWDETTLAGPDGLRLRGFSRTGRCAATEVDPATARRDPGMVALLERLYGHHDFGVYLAVAAAGRLAVGDRLEPAPA